jgi:hypothetical protein
METIRGRLHRSLVINFRADSETALPTYFACIPDEFPRIVQLSLLNCFDSIFHVVDGPCCELHLPNPRVKPTGTIHSRKERKITSSTDGTGGAPTAAGILPKSGSATTLSCPGLPGPVVNSGLPRAFATCKRTPDLMPLPFSLDDIIAAVLIQITLLAECTRAEWATTGEATLD